MKFTQKINSLPPKWIFHWTQQRKHWSNGHSSLYNESKWRMTGDKTPNIALYQNSSEATQQTGARNQTCISLLIPSMGHYWSDVKVKCSCHTDKTKALIFLSLKARVPIHILYLKKSSQYVLQLFSFSIQRGKKRFNWFLSNMKMSTLETLIWAKYTLRFEMRS